jgi:hypothetical protein
MAGKGGYPDTVFVLGTGRCGTTTFMRACRHVTNFTAAHESRVNRSGADRLAYPPRHIEADNRLSWFLGQLDETYGPRALYVHMLRDEEAVVASYLKRWKIEGSIVYGWRTAIVPRPGEDVSPAETVRDMVRAVKANVRAFLKDKPLAAEVHLETATEDFARVWDVAGFAGDRAAALAEWKLPYNAAPPPLPSGMAKLARLPAKLGRIARKLPDFLDRA